MEAQFTEKHKCIYLVDFSADFPNLFHYELMKTQVLWDFLLFIFSRLSRFSSIKTPDDTQKQNTMYKKVDEKASTSLCRLALSTEAIYT